MDPTLSMDIEAQARAVASELLAKARLAPGAVIVVGCSTSEVVGQRIGTATSPGAAAAVLAGLAGAIAGTGIDLAIQCCEHLNRALVVERSVADRLGLDEVTVVPKPGAGGALAAEAMERLADPVVVEAIKAHAAIDIGETLIGMHLRPVAVPLRPAQNRIGEARVTMAMTRPKLIGGERAVYRRG